MITSLQYVRCAPDYYSWLSLTSNYPSSPLIIYLLYVTWCQGLAGLFPLLWQRCWCPKLRRAPAVGADSAKWETVAAAAATFLTQPLHFEEDLADGGTDNISSSDGTSCTCRGGPDIQSDYTGTAPGRSAICQREEDARNRKQWNNMTINNHYCDFGV